MSDVVIIGNGIAGNLAATFIRGKYPALEVTLVGKDEPNRPIVGESTVEVSSHFLREIGLGYTLVEKHYPKYGLTYYYKAALDDPSDRRYMVDEAPAIPPLSAFQLNRFTFDQQVRDHNVGLGVRYLPHKAVDITLGTRGQKHTVTMRDEAGETSTIDARFVIDATGRRRFLGQKMDIHEATTPQRSAWWFRLVDFDERFLEKIQCIKKHPNTSYNSYYATHHVFGRGNWIWMIPVRTPDYKNMISIGITWRPDLYPHDIRNIDDFMKYVGMEHPMVTDMVKSGKVWDIAAYRKYMYWSKRRYSDDGWYVLGDASSTTDPLYSAGLVLVSIQIRQIGALIGHQLEGRSSPELVAEYDDAYACFYKTASHEVSSLYDVMHHPWKCHMRQYLTVLTGFHLPVPLLMLDYASDPVGVKLFRKVARPEIIEKDLSSLKMLIDQAGDRIRHFDPADYIKVQSAESMNWGFFENVREEMVPDSMGRLFSQLSTLRVDLMKRLGVRSAFDRRQQSDMAGHLARVALAKTLLHNQKLRDNPAVRWYVGAKNADAS